MIWHAQKQYRYVIEHAPANFDSTEGRTVFIEMICSDVV